MRHITQIIFKIVFDAKNNEVHFALKIQCDDTNMIITNVVQIY